MPRSVFITTSTLVVLAALGGFWLGQKQVTLDATGVIEAVAVRHVAEHGGEVSSCFGWAGQGDSVFEVQCGEARYAIDRLGRARLIVEDGI